MNNSNLRDRFLVITSLILIANLSSQISHAYPSSKSKSRLKPNLCIKNVTDSPNSLTKCITLNHQYCLNIELPYSSTYIPENIHNLNFKRIHDVQDYLSRWQEVRRIPKCWISLQTTLCSIFMPQCNEDANTSKATSLSKPSAELCSDLVGKGNCRFIERHFNWSQLFNCSDSNIYQKNCTNDITDFRLNYTYPECQYPLVPSNDAKSVFKDIDGCDLHCKYPLLDTVDQSIVHYLIAYLCVIGLFLTGFALVLFICNLNFQKSSKIAKTIIWNNIFQFLHFIGWSLQFISKSDIACNSEGARLQDLTLMGNLCVLSFILIYFSSISSLFWFAYLGKLCHEKLTSGERRKKSTNLSNKLDTKFCLVSFTIPSILLIIVAFFGKIDGHGLYGICTVGQHSFAIKAFFLFFPVLTGVLYGNVYFSRIIYKLARVKVMKSVEKRRLLLRIIVLSLLTLLHTITTIANYVIQDINYAKWTDAIDKYIACTLDIRPLHNYSETIDDLQKSECSIESKPHLMFYCIEIFCTFAIGMVISTWSWCDQNFRALRRTLINCLENETERRRRLLPNVTKSVVSGSQISAHNETFRDPIDMPITSATNAPDKDDPEIASAMLQSNINNDRPPSVSSKTISFMDSESIASNFRGRSMTSGRFQMHQQVMAQNFDGLQNPLLAQNSDINDKLVFIDGLATTLVVQKVPFFMDQMILGVKLLEAAKAMAPPSLWQNLWQNLWSTLMPLPPQPLVSTQTTKTNVAEPTK